MKLFAGTPGWTARADVIVIGFGADVLKRALSKS